MHFRLKRPCSNCPFRRDPVIYLRPSRVGHLLHQVLDEELSFACHKTFPYEGLEDAAHEEGMCAGAIALIRKEGKPHRILQIAERLGIFKPETVDMDEVEEKAPVFDSRQDMLDHFKKLHEAGSFEAFKRNKAGEEHGKAL